MGAWAGMAWRGEAMPVRGIVLSLLGCLAAVTLVAPAHADCVDDCQAATYCDSTMYATGECNSKILDCYNQQCNRSQESYGAIAYGAKSQAYGFSFDAGDADSAANTAMTKCKSHGNDCELVLSFSNSCGAVAAVSNSESFGTGQGADRGVAEFNALASCKKNDSGDCEVQVWSCALP